MLPRRERPSGQRLSGPELLSVRITESPGSIEVLLVLICMARSHGLGRSRTDASNLCNTLSRGSITAAGSLLPPLCRRPMGGTRYSQIYIDSEDAASGLGVGASN